MNVIVIHGAPGSGKTTVAGLLHRHLKSPWFEFGWIPEFTRRNPHTDISGEDEAQLSFENLMLVTKNYIRHGFENIILSDLDDARMPNIVREFEDTPYIIITLLAEDDDLLKQRILARTGENTYKDWAQAQRINERIVNRPPLLNEVRICVDRHSVEEVAEQVLALIEHAENAGGAVSGYVYQPATPAQLERRWDINIANNSGDARWVAWKTQMISDNQAGICKTFVVLCGDEPVGEGTMLFSPLCGAVGGRTELADGAAVANINALRMDRAFEGKGHMSRLMRTMEAYAAGLGIRRLTIGVEPCEARNAAIYRHWGYTTFVAHAIEEDGELVLYYAKDL